MGEEALAARSAPTPSLRGKGIKAHETKGFLP